jgi:hypothetical protein
VTTGQPCRPSPAGFFVTIRHGAKRLTVPSNGRPALINPEPLRADLQQYVTRQDNLTILRSPWHSGPIDPEHCAAIHEEIDSKEAQAAELLEKRDWVNLFLNLSRPFRLSKFLEWEHLFSDRDYWKRLKEVYTDAEGTWVNRDIWLAHFTSARPQREYLMSNDEWTRLAEMPHSFPVYRGFGGKHGLSISWTFDRDKAVWFANRFKALGKPKLTSGTIQRSKVLALFLGRDESEIVADWNHVTDRKTESI